MNVRRSRKWLLGGVVGAAMLLAGVAALILVGRSGSASAQPAESKPSPTKLLEHVAGQAGVQDLQTLVSVGSGRNNVAIITGTNGSGSPCWTIVRMGGNVGGAFRCGSPPAPEQGPLWVSNATGGAAGSVTADYANVVGLVSPSVASVQVTLADGSTRPLTIIGGAFAYASTSADDLPKSVRAYDASGRLVGEEDIILASGLP